MTKNFCTECGNELKESKNFCPVCGTKLKKETPKKEIKIPKKDFNLTKKHALIIAIAIIIVIALILIATGGFSNTPSHIKDVKVSKAGKVYKIDFDCDIGNDKILIQLLKDGENLYTTKGTLGEWANGDSVAIELVKDVDIDEISFYVYGSDDNILDKGSVKNFDMTKEKNIQDIGVTKEDTSKKTANDIYEDNK